MALTDEERQRIREEEEFRAEVRIRAEIEAHRKYAEEIRESLWQRQGFVFCPKCIHLDQTQKATASQRLPQPLRPVAVEFPLRKIELKTREELYYCHRCDAVFLPGAPSATPLPELPIFLQEELRRRLIDRLVRALRLCRDSAEVRVRAEAEARRKDEQEQAAQAARKNVPVIEGSILKDRDAMNAIGKVCLVLALIFILTYAIAGILTLFGTKSGNGSVTQEVVSKAAPKGASEGPSVVPSVQVRGKSIAVGDTADYVFSVLYPTEMERQEVAPDPKLPGSLTLTKYFAADGKSFGLSLARQRDPGPYVVTKILLLNRR